ncbi:MAG TPA: peptide chain release factor N(5)-glutamine methyltransferase [Pyrinomonadaceae bacterium]|nr:peptide chain release factor N(5)-glutamine methyltransferase [Pyrinomonadaceae bacterium]
MPTSIAETILEGAHRLRKAGVPEARREAGSLLGYVLGRDRSFILTHAEDAISEEQAERFRECLERRAQGEPLQYITANQEFFGLDFEVTKDVLIPRPETELLIETALKLLTPSADAFICDVGTGSGCIVITLMQQLKQARAVAIEISLDALAVARRNAVRHSVAERIDFVHSDCFAALNSRAPRPSFDLIVSNPPYVEDGAMADLQREVRDFEPRSALAAGADGLDIIRRLLLEAPSFLKTGGYFLLEIGFNQAAAVEQLLDPKIWRLIDINKDLQGIPRTVALQRL